MPYRREWTDPMTDAWLVAAARIRRTFARSAHTAGRHDVAALNDADAQWLDDELARRLATPRGPGRRRAPAPSLSEQGSPRAQPREVDRAPEFGRPQVGRVPAVLKPRP